MTQGLDLCRIPTSAYIKEYFIRYGRIPAAIAAVLLLIAFVAGFSDMRWWLIGLMELFVVIPMIIAMSCFIAAGRKDMALRLHPFTVSSDGDAVRLDFYRFDAEDENRQAYQSVLLTGDRIRKVAFGKRFIRITAAGDRLPFDFILIPKDALPHSAIFEKFEYDQR